MAAVDNVTMVEGGPAGLEVSRVQLTGSTATYISKKFNTVIAFTYSVEGTNTCTATRSGRTITFTGTNDDWVNVFIAGLK